MIAITIITLSCTWYYHSIKPILVGICFWLWFGTRTFLRVRRQQDAFFKKHPEVFLDARQTRSWMLVTAHPDDEAMFFTPFIKAILTQRKVKLYLLCLSRGDYYGQGRQRVQELLASCKVLDISSEHVAVIDHPKLQDGPETDWPPRLTASIIQDYADKWSVSSIVTFDANGTSGHINHRACFRGVQLMAAEAREREALRKQPSADGTSRGSSANAKSPPHIWLLQTMGIRKYLGILDTPMWVGRLQDLSSSPDNAKFMLANPDIPSAWRAMKSHASQFTWYRKLFVLTASYSYFNVLSRLDLDSKPEAHEAEQTKAIEFTH